MPVPQTPIGAPGRGSARHLLPKLLLRDPEAHTLRACHLTLQGSSMQLRSQHAPVTFLHHLSHDGACPNKAPRLRT